MIVIMCVVGYFLISVVLGHVIWGLDYINYIRTGKLDHKFPANRFETYKVVQLFCLFWLPFMILYLYRWVDKKSTQ